MNYTEEQLAILHKAGLIKTGKVKVVAAQRTTLESRSEDGTQYELVKRSNLDDNQHPMKTITVPVRDRSGRIAGYWANGLTREEQEKLNVEIGVPYYYLGEPINSLTGKPMHKDSTIAVSHGIVYDLSNPIQCAEFNILMYTGAVWPNERSCRDNQGDFYFFSEAEIVEEKKELLSVRKQAAELVNLSIKDKQQIYRILCFMETLSSDPYIDIDNAVLAFDDACFTIPEDVVEVNKLERKGEYVMIYALLYHGYIIEESKDGPYYKNPDVYGGANAQAIHLADTMSELVKEINKHQDLVKQYYDLADQINGMQNINTGGKYNDVVIDDMNKLLSKHQVKDNAESGKASLIKQDNPVEDSVETFKKMTRMWTTEKFLNWMEQEGIMHSFTQADPVAEIKKYVYPLLENNTTV
jgi:hypothetical protein